MIRWGGRNCRSYPDFWAARLHPFWYLRLLYLAAISHAYQQRTGQAQELINTLDSEQVFR